MTRNGKELPRSSLRLILKQIILAPFGLRGLFVPGIDDRTGCRSSLPHPQTEKQPVFVTLNNTVTLDAPQHLAMQHARRVRSRCLGIGVRRYGIVRVSELIWLLRSKSSTALVYVIASVPSMPPGRVSVTGRLMKFSGLWLVVHLQFEFTVRSYGFLTVRELALFLKSKNFIALVYVVVSVPSSALIPLSSCAKANALNRPYLASCC